MTLINSEILKACIGFIWLRIWSSCYLFK